MIKRNFVVGVSDIDILCCIGQNITEKRSRVTLPEDAGTHTDWQTIKDLRKIDQRGTTISALFALTQNRQRTRALCQLILSSFSVLNYSEYMKLCFNVIILRLFYVVFIILVLCRYAVLS